MDLAQKKCVPCEGGVPVLPPARVEELLRELEGWELEGNRIRRRFTFEDFAGTMRFVNAIAELAEAEGHHPDLYVHDWNRLDVATWTHAIRGLSENDFVLAAKIDGLHRSEPERWRAAR